MCGIAGGIGALGSDPDPLRRMVEALRLRGPDDSGSEVITKGDRACWLGNTRLSIQDLSAAGHMPMVEEETGNWITYNGEVYNFPELRRDLESGGERFRSRTDTEVVLKLYRREGASALSKLRGMFAFALWDESKGEIFLARDRVGKKPLYYAAGPGRFLFASEIRAVLASGMVERRLSRDGLACFLANGFLVSPQTILDGCVGLLPGHCMRVGIDGEIRSLDRYWAPGEGPDAGLAAADGSERIRETFQEAVTARLVSDVPVGIFLSGGMDSSAIVGAVCRAHEQVRTFSLAFPGSALDESDHSRKVARHWETAHTEVPVGAKEFLGWLPQALDAMDQPTYDGVNSFFVSKAAHDAGLKVVLSGIGADELFGGYPSFRAVPLKGVIAALAATAPTLFTLTGGAASRLGSSRMGPAWRLADLLGVRWGRRNRARFEAAFYQVTQILHPSWTRHALLNGHAGTGEGYPTRFGLPDAFALMMEEELAGLAGADAFSHLAWRLFLGERCLRDVDSMSMGVSLEVRAPFTDQVFVEMVRRLPGSRRCVAPPDKPFERSLLEPFLREAWTPRAKQGFVMPFTSWLATGEGNERIGAVLSDGPLLTSIGLVPAAVRALWETHRRAPARVPWSAVWAIFVLATWCRRHRVSS